MVQASDTASESLPQVQKPELEDQAAGSQEVGEAYD